MVMEGDTTHLLWFNEYFHGATDSLMGIFYSHSFDGGATFSQPVQLVPLAGAGVEGTSGNGLMAVSGKHVYLAYEAIDTLFNYFLAFRQSTDGGVTWGKRLLLNDDLRHGIAAHDSSVYIRFTTGVLASHDYGKTFDTAAIGLPPGWSDAGIGNFIVAGGSLHYVYMLGFPDGNLGYLEVMYTRSTDLGRTWTDPRILSSNDSITSQAPRIACDGHGNIYVAWSDFKYGSIDGWHGSILLRNSSDNGISWGDEQLLSSLGTAIFPTLSANDRSVVASWSQFNDYSHDRILMHMSHDQGVSWCDTLQVDPLGGDVDCAIEGPRLFIVWFRLIPVIPPTYFGELFIRRGRVPVVTPLPSTLTLYQNFPNPFNGTTKIRYDIPENARGAVSIVIYNLLGQTVAGLVDEPSQKAGTYEVEWTPRRFSSGVYFYKLRVGATSTMKKLLLIK